MLTLRATRRVLRLLSAPAADPGRTSTALGDWYVDRLVVDRHPLLLLVSSTSLLSIVHPARAVRQLPAHLPSLVAKRLHRLGVASRVIDAEVAAMEPVHVGPTRDKSVLGSMVQFVRNLPYYLPVDGWDETTLPFVEMQLAQTPCRLTGRDRDVIWPDRDAQQLLAERWGK